MSHPAIDLTALVKAAMTAAECTWRVVKVPLNPR